MDILGLLGRKAPLFSDDIACREVSLREALSEASCLVVGGAGSIGQAVTRELFKREPRILHVVDISENSTVELVRDIRSTLGYNRSDFRTFSIDCAGPEFTALYESEGPYDYVFNLSALKHVRSEKDPFTLMRMIRVNVFNTLHTLRLAREGGALKYFSVSTDKAANPVNLMGASKRVMELFLMRESIEQPISMARFANVAFSDGSLLHGFNQRFAKRQPISAPCDVRRYFITPQESGELCLLSTILGESRDVFFPKLSDDLHLLKFSEIAKRYVRGMGYEPYECGSEDEARSEAASLIRNGRWPCYFFFSDTTGEKDVEEFFTDSEQVDLDRFFDIGVIKNRSSFDSSSLLDFERFINEALARGSWNKPQIIEAFLNVIPDLRHVETGKYLDQRM